MCAGEIKDKNIVTGGVGDGKEAADDCKPMTEELLYQENLPLAGFFLA